VAPKTETPKKKLDGLDRRQLLDLYRTMLISRKVDDKEIQLKRQNKIFFQINGVGHEAIGAAVGHVFKPGKDWFFFYYRDRAASAGLGLSAYEMFLQAAGTPEDAQSGGRQMPAHFSSRPLNIANTSSPTGTQFLQAVGAAEAGRYGGNIEGTDVDRADDEVVLVTTGDGTTSQGEFWESLNTASNMKLPVVYLVEDNGFAISVPVADQTPGGSISKLVAAYPNFHIEDVDGCDVVASVKALERAHKHCRQGKGPALIHASVIRPYSHSLSDDESHYKTAAEREKEAARDPLVTFPRLLVEKGIVDEEVLTALDQQLDEEIQQAADRAFEASRPEPESALRWVYSEDVDPTSSLFESQPATDGQPTTMVDLINSCMRDEMRRDPRILLFGEDVADARPEALDEVKGKGGVFKVTWGLQREFGATRVFNSPLAEANIVGRAIGQALRGLRPVVEIQFFDYIWPAYHQIRNELATMRWRSADAFSCPVVIRVPYGGYIRGGAIYHSQSGASLLTHNPGLRVVCPSNALDANGLLRTAIRADDPVLFLEHKHLYRQTYNKGVYPGPDYMIPFGKAHRVQEGDDITIVTYGATVHRSVQALRGLRDEGITADILDLRTLSPVDWDSIRDSVRKTSKCLVLYEDAKSWGYGAEIAARLSEEMYTELDGPVRRLAATDTFVGYAPELEDFILPQVADIQDAVRDLVNW